jgi:hypothetical protein
MFGPTGAMIGAAAGHFLVDRKGELPQKQSERMLALTAGALYQIALAGGRFSRVEDDTIRIILEQANAVLGNVMSRYDLYYLIDHSARIPEAPGKLARSVSPHPELARLAATWCWRMAVCEGTPAPAALSMIERFVRGAGLTPEQAAQAALLYWRGAAALSQGGSGRERACSVLGVAYDAGGEEIKQAFRRQSLKYHPDKHAALDPDIRQLTAEKFAQIKEAYDTLQGTAASGGDWYAHAPDAPHLLAAAPGLEVRCFVCRRPQRMPQLSLAESHCPLCQALLVFDRPLAEHLIAQETAGI